MPHKVADDSQPPAVTCAYDIWTKTGGDAAMASVIGALPGDDFTSYVFQSYSAQYKLAAHQYFKPGQTVSAYVRDVKTVTATCQADGTWSTGGSPGRSQGRGG